MPPTRAWLLEELYKTAKSVFELDDLLRKIMGSDANSFVGLVRSVHSNPEVIRIQNKMNELDDKQKSLIKMLDTVKV